MFLKYNKYGMITNLKLFKSPAIKRCFSCLANIIADTIKISGPIPVSEYMQYALYHPMHGYYSSNRNGSGKGFIGHDGDFITSPEVSQLFGEMIGIFFILQSERIPKHIPIHIIELGPGNGTLLFDILKTISSFPHVQQRISLISLVEICNVMKEKQKHSIDQLSSIWKKDIIYHNMDDTIQKFHINNTDATNVVWHNHWSTINKDNHCPWIIAHEFLDALPIRQFQKIHYTKPWHEILVDYNELDSTFHPTLCPIPLKESDTLWLKFIQEESIPSDPDKYPLIYEYCPSILQHVTWIKRLLTNSYGISLWIDYGTEYSTWKNTLRGIESHQFCSPFLRPGIVDLSSNVNFGHLSRLLTCIDTELQAFKCIGPLDQDKFLFRLGIKSRLHQLLSMNNIDVNMKQLLMRGYQRLEEISKAYKVLVGYDHMLEINDLTD